MASSPQLRKHITCQLCHNVFRDPHTLRCLHTFCLQCIKNLQHKGNLECATCSQITNVKDLQRDFKTEALVHDLSRFSSRSMKCDMCDDEASQVKLKCVDCDQMMCERCELTHSKMKVSKNHKVIEVNKSLKLPQPSLINKNNHHAESTKATHQDLKHVVGSKETISKDKINKAVNTRKGTICDTYKDNNYKQINPEFKHIKHKQYVPSRKAPNTFSQEIGCINIVSPPLIRKSYPESYQGQSDAASNYFDDPSSQNCDQYKSQKGNDNKKSRFNNVFRWGFLKKISRRRKDYWDDRFKFDDSKENPDKPTDEQEKEWDENEIRYEKNDYWDDRRIIREDFKNEPTDRWEERVENLNEQVNDMDKWCDRNNEGLNDWADKRTDDSDPLIDRVNDDSEQRDADDDMSDRRYDEFSGLSGTMPDLIERRIEEDNNDVNVTDDRIEDTNETREDWFDHQHDGNETTAGWSDNDADEDNNVTWSQYDE